MYDEVVYLNSRGLFSSLVGKTGIVESHTHTHTHTHTPHSWEAMREGSTIELEYCFTYSYGVAVVIAFLD